MSNFKKIKMIDFNDVFQITLLAMIGLLVGLKIYELKKRFSLPTPSALIPPPPILRTPYQTQV